MVSDKLVTTLCDAAVELLQRMLTMLQTIDSNVLSFRKLGVIVFGCWTVLRFKECMIKTLLNESIQVGTRVCGQGMLLDSRLSPTALCQAHYT